MEGIENLRGTQTEGNHKRKKKKMRYELKGPPILPGSFLYCKYVPLGGNQCKRQLAAGA